MHLFDMMHLQQIKYVLLMCRRHKEAKESPVHLCDMQENLLSGKLTQMAFWSTPAVKLGHANIAKISGMTNLRSLELQDWEEWEALKPLRALSMLENLSCSGCHMLLEIMSCASWSNMKAIVLSEYQYENPSARSNMSLQRWLHDKGIDPEAAHGMLATMLLQLPQLASIQDKCQHFPTGSGQDTPSTIGRVVSLHTDQWRQLKGQPGLLLYHRIRGWNLSWWLLTFHLYGHWQRHLIIVFLQTGWLRTSGGWFVCGFGSKDIR